MENNITNEIKKLKTEIVPRAGWVTLNRDILLKQINQDQGYQKSAVGFFGYWSIFNQAFRQRMFEPALVMLLILGSFVASSLTINAAFYSLPGDGLYQVKLTLERTHAALVPDEEKKVELKMEFAQKRVAEFNKIVSQSNDSPEVKKKKIAQAVREFKNNVTEASSHLSKINQEGLEIDQDLTVKMALTISEKTEELAKDIDKTAGNLGEVDKQELGDILAQAVQSAQDVNLTAKQVISEAATISDEDQTIDEAGAVQGAANEEETSVAEETATVTDSNNTDQIGVQTGDSQVADPVVTEETVEN